MTRQIHQIVVPLQYRPSILKVAHDIPMAGHLGVTKTKDRILAHFYWPNIFQDVANYCKTCSVYKFIDKGKAKHPLSPCLSLIPLSSVLPLTL